jgi:thiol-disulfide isomerase/thioredoxin
VRTLDGRTLRLDELRGRPVVLDFWATWCAPCRASMPLLSAMQGRYGTRGLVVVGLSVDDGPTQAVRRFAERLRLRFPVAMASEGMLDDYGPIRSIPTTIFIDRRGRIVRRVTGYVDEETLEGFIREIL